MDIVWSWSMTCCRTSKQHMIRHTPYVLLALVCSSFGTFIDSIQWSVNMDIFALILWRRHYETICTIFCYGTVFLRFSCMVLQHVQNSWSNTNMSHRLPRTKNSKHVWGAWGFPATTGMPWHNLTKALEVPILICSIKANHTKWIGQKNSYFQ